MVTTLRTILRSVIPAPVRPFARRLHARLTTQPGKADTYQLHTLEVMYETLRDSSNVIDIGAHKGSVLRWVTRLAPHGQHMAIEPLPFFAAVLRREYPEVAVHGVALSDRAGEATFMHVVNNPAYSGFRRQDSYPQPPIIEELHVPTVRLDDLVPDTASIDFIKIDVEGAELQVLRGAAHTLARTRAVIVCEHVGSPEVPSASVYDLLQDCGLRVFRMADWLAGEREPMTATLFTELYTSGLEYYFMATR